MAGRPARNLEERIRSAPVLEAHRLLLAETPRLGLTPSHNTGHVHAVRLHDEHNRYVFSWIVNPHHLLFYVRPPALNSQPSLRAAAHKALPRPTENTAGEVKSRLEGKQDAETVLAWLKSSLPLPPPD